MADIARIIDDLETEHRVLDALVSEISEESWNVATPAEGWDIQDQVGHLAFFDDEAHKALEEPDVFRSDLEGIVADLNAFYARSVGKGRAMDGTGVLAWWREARVRMLGAARAYSSTERIPWYGRPMSLASFVSARQMETWAHAQDVADALHAVYPNDDRIKNVTHLCVLARGNAYNARGMTPPEEPVRVELVSPEGNRWEWGEGEQSIVGTAVDFCLVSVQRRHPEDTELELNGDLAREWMSIAQSFAGPPGGGRQAGQFPKVDA